jgi:SAM-dependent methyltransferase
MNESSRQPSYRQSHQAPGHGRRYDELLFTQGAYDAAVWQLEQNALFEIIQKYFSGRITNALDFACGTGRITVFMAPLCERVIGLDISPEMLAEAKRKAPDVSFICGDLTQDHDLLRAYAPFDCVTAFRFFLNAEPELRAQALAALRTIIKPGGFLICNNHGNSLSFWTPVRWIRRGLGKPVIPSTMPYPVFRKLLREHGFDLVEVRGVAFLPRGLFRVLPQKLWRLLEKSAARWRVFNAFAIYQIYVARRKP